MVVVTYCKGGEKMGLICSCGARSNPTSSGEITLLFDDGETRSETLTINVDVCEDRLELSTFTATFVDQSGMIPNRNFVFTSTEVTGVDCILVNNQCRVVINGMGLITGDPTLRGFFVVISNSLPHRNLWKSLIFLYSQRI